MRSIRLKVYFIACLSLIGAFVFAGRAYKFKQDLVSHQLRINESLEVRAVATKLAHAESLDTGDLGKIRSWRRSLEPAERKTAVNKLAAALSSSSSSIRERAQEVIQVEGRFFAEYGTQADQDLARIEREIMISFGILALGLILTLQTVRARIFRPLHKLSRRMKDFLVDRYSFQFAHPDASELGDLQKTFNSLAQRVINSMEELRALDQTKSEFLNIASHELRTPLTSIKGSLSLLVSGVMGEVPQPSARLIKIAETETDRLIRLINDLLDLAKIEAGKLPLAKAWLPWDTVISKTVEGLLGLAHKAEVHIKADPAPSLEVFIDLDRIQQILTNLISNAIKFSPHGSWVHITLGQTERGELLISVRDQGPGISPEDQLGIFQKFKQVGPKAKDDAFIKGTGLGLPIAKALVTEHGGTIGIHSEPGKGSTFWFTLPDWRDDESSSEESPQHSRVA